eukprot:scaffold649495_cov48-Prasinocladus_malaysianus.AAC.1
MLAEQLEQQAWEMSQLRQREASLRQTVELFRLTLRPFADAIGSLVKDDQPAQDYCQSEVSSFGFANFLRTYLMKMQSAMFRWSPAYFNP